PGRSAHTIQPGHYAALADERDRLCRQSHRDALVLHELDPEVVRGHLGATAAVDHRHPLCTEALGDGRGVDGGVACSDDHHLVTHLDLVQVDETPLLGHLGGCDERQSLDDPTEFLAWHCQVRHPARPGCDDDGVVVGYQSGRLDVASDLDAGVDGDSETLYELDLFQRDLDGLAHDDDAVGRQPARQVVALEDVYLDAAFGQLTCCTETSWARPDDSHALADLGSSLERRNAAAVHV